MWLFYQLRKVRESIIGLTFFDSLIAEVARIDYGRSLQGNCVSRSSCPSMVDEPFVVAAAADGHGSLLDRWKRAVETDPDVRRRTLYRDSALVFAELTPRQPNWLRGMEGWLMRESQTIKGWMREGAEIAELRTKRDFLLEAVKVRLENSVPESIRLAIEGTNDLSKPELWYDAALKVKSIGELRK